MGFTFRILSQKGLIQKGCSEIDYPYEGSGLFVESFKKNVYDATDDTKAYKVSMSLNEEGNMTMAVYDTHKAAKEAVSAARAAYQDFVYWIVDREANRNSPMPFSYFRLP